MLGIEVLFKLLVKQKSHHFKQISNEVERYDLHKSHLPPMIANGSLMSKLQAIELEIEKDFTILTTIIVLKTIAMSNSSISFLLVCVLFSSALLGQNDLALQGIIDFTVPSGASNGKAIHLVANNDISDLSTFGIGVANNGGGTDGQEYTFPATSVSSGDDILVVRSVSAMEAYFSTCFEEFEHVLLDEGSSISQNGDDAIELFSDGDVLEVFGDIDVDGTGEAWEYLDSWAFKVEGDWTFGEVNCTDGSNTTFDSNCPYPLCELPDEIPGCTDETAFNFNPNATEDDGSCVEIAVGCMIASADNYNEVANTACEDCCLFGGCTDADALNFDDAANTDDGSCIYDSGNLTNALMLKGIIDFTVPSGSSNGKAVHLVALEDIADLSIFGLGVANNGGGTDGEEFTLPTMSVSAGDDILVARTPAAMEAYFEGCYEGFEHVLESNSSISQNGDDAIELFESGIVIEVFGDVDTSGSGQDWEYLDSWAFKMNGAWTYGGVNCTDEGATTFESACVYPMCIALGCTDPFYVEFDPYANADDESCLTMKVWGCLYEEATNYDASANVDDGSCIVEASSCTGDLDNDGLVATPDLLAFLSLFGTECE
tara:strand:+ start:4294 stop:6096 length:1803 start_codon:yes stop_codon:yes gene_type:complete